MKNLIYASAIALSMLFSACENEEAPANTQDNNENNNSQNTPVNLDNNTIYAGSYSGKLKHYTAHRATDVNTNKENIVIFVYGDDLRGDHIEIGLKEVPSTNKTLNWQSGSAAPGDLTPDQFLLRTKADGNNWYGILATDGSGYQTTGEMIAEVNGNKLVLSFQNIELADNSIESKIEARSKVSGKVSLNLDDLQNLDVSPRREPFLLLN
jgi:hypothetical protein